LLGDGSPSGIGNVTGGFFFTPSRLRADGVTWSIGPAVVVPTGTDFVRGAWALGPTASCFIDRAPRF
jgi:hypothetical protein